MEDAAEEVFQHRHKGLVNICENIPLEQQFYEFTCATTLSNEDVRKREGFFNELETLLQELYPNCKCQLYGSYLIGVSDRDSDLDVFVDMGVNLRKMGSEDPEMTESSESLTLDEVFDGVLKHLRRKNKIRNAGREGRGHRFRSIIGIPARVPIIRLVHEETLLHCDISFSSHTSVINSNLMKFFTQYDHRVRPLMMFLRYWGRFHSLLGSNKLTPYALMLMVVVYLNQKQVLPSVLYLQELIGTKPPLIVEGWNVAFEDDVKVVRQSIANTGFAPVPLDFFESELSYKDILELAQGFFEMFGSFDFEVFVLCPLMGTDVDKAIFQNEDTFVLSTFPSSYNKLKKFRYSSPMCIQDPFLLDFNMTNSITNKFLKRFKSLCRETSTFLDRIFILQSDNEPNLFSEVFHNVEDDFLSKNARRRQLLQMSMQDPLIDSVKVKKEVPFVGKPVPVIETPQAIQSQNIKGEESMSTTPQEFATDITMTEFNNFDDPEDVDVDVSDCCILPDVIHYIKNPLHRTTFTHSLELSICTEFKQLFMIVLSALDDVVGLDNRMKVAWITFTDEFFRVIFAKGFGLKTIAARKLPYHLIENFNIEEARARRELGLDCLPYSVGITWNEITGLSTIRVLSEIGKQANIPKSPSSILNRKRKLNPRYFEEEVEEKRGKDVVQSIPILLEDFSSDDPEAFYFASPNPNPTPFDLPAISRGFPTSEAEIPETAEKNGNSQSQSNGDGQVVEQPIQNVVSEFSIPPMTKDMYSKLIAGLRKPFTMEYDVAGTADAFIGRERRVFERALFAKSKKSEPLSINPINLEEIATKSFKGINSTNVAGQMGVSFQCKLSVETSAPFVMVHFKEDLDSGKFPVVQLIRDGGFSQIFHQYTLFRLKKMLTKVGSNCAAPQ